MKDCTKDQIDALDSKGFAALHYAVKLNKDNMVRSLLENEVKCGKFGCAMCSSALCKLAYVLAFFPILLSFLHHCLPSSLSSSLPPSFSPSPMFGIRLYCFQFEGLVWLMFIQSKLQYTMIM